MLDAWAKAYADRWGLPQPAVAEIVRVMDAVRRGDLADSGADTRPGYDSEVAHAGGGQLSSHDELLRAASLPPDERYEEMGMIGEGGMGEVRRVWDNALHRSVAMKVLRGDLAERDDLVHRFVEEAQATAQLEHPGIMPVYDVGRLPDGRPYFTMKEIRGRSLLDVIEEVHQESTSGWAPTPSGWTFQRLINVIQQVCEAVAFAHSRGVLHRDLKPTNVMVGAFGEVVVMDWGLAKVASLSGGSGPIPQPRNPVITVRSRGGMYVTRSGSVAGTPNYMPPEQARGEHGLVGPWSDVYALGALLYEVLADRAPYDGEDLDDVVQKVLAAPPPVPYPRFQSAQSELPYPEDSLRAICLKAMARKLEDRYMDAVSLAEAIREWLDNAGARERAIELVRRADAIDPEIVALRKRIATLRADAASVLGSLAPTAAADQKRAGWALEDLANDIEQELVKKQVRYANFLQAALAGVPDLPEAAARLEVLSESAASPGIVRTIAKTGDGFLTVVTEPAVCKVTLRKIESIDRRLEPVPVMGYEQLRTPIDRLRLPAGSWSLKLEADGHDALTVHALVRSGELSSTAPPGTQRPQAIRLARRGVDTPPPSSVPNHLIATIRIPAGWSHLGGDLEVRDSLPRNRTWVDAFLIRKYPVTVGEYVPFLDERGESFPSDWRPDEPVRNVTFEEAHAFARWLADKTGVAWRLPREREWERAARGVDERIYPWGNFLDPSWVCIADSFTSHEEAGAQPVTAFAEDVSPYGVRGLGGNVRDWVVDDRAPRSLEAAAPQFRWVRGGHWQGIAQLARSALRYRLPVPSDDTTGFRLVAPIPG